MYMLVAMLSPRVRLPLQLGVEHGSVVARVGIGQRRPRGKGVLAELIAVFGPDAPKDATPQDITSPLHGVRVSKVSGELWCQYYHQQYGVDVRSLRYLVYWLPFPAWRHTDYAVEAIPRRG